MDSSEEDRRRINEYYSRPNLPGPPKYPSWRRDWDNNEGAAGGATI